MSASTPEIPKRLNLESILSTAKSTAATGLLEKAPASSDLQKQISDLLGQAPASLDLEKQTTVQSASSALPEQSAKPLLESTVSSQAVIEKNITSIFKTQEALQKDVKQIADQLNQLIQSIQSASAETSTDTSEQTGGRRKTLRVKKGKKPSRNRRT